jgi:hypothetical protein
MAKRTHKIGNNGFAYCGAKVDMHRLRAKWVDTTCKACRTKGMDHMDRELKAHDQADEKMTIADISKDGAKAVLDGMDLPDGAHMAMADELGLQPEDL